MKHIPEIHKSLLPSLKALDPLQTVTNTPLAALPAFIRDIHDVKPRLIKILDFIIAIEANHGVAYPSYISIGKRLKVSEATIERDVNVLERMGIVTTAQGYMTSLVYSVNAKIKLINYRLLQYLPSLKRTFFALTVLSSPNIIAKENFEALRRREVAIKKLSSIEGVSGFLGSLGYLKRMHDNQKEKVTNFIKALPFELDMGQKIYLCQYPLEILKYAREDLFLATRINNPWQYFLAQCRNRAEASASVLETGWRDELKQKYGLVGMANLEEAKYILTDAAAEVLLDMPTERLRHGWDKVDEEVRIKRAQQRESSRFVSPANAPGTPKIPEQIRLMSQPAKPHSYIPRPPHNPSSFRPVMSPARLAIKVNMDACKKNIAFLESTGTMPEALIVCQEKMAKLERELALLGEQ